MHLQRRLSELVAYYNEAASEFDKGYDLSAESGREEDRYNAERLTIDARVRSFGHGSLLDIGAGTGYWLDRYVTNAESVLLIEPSPAMCASIEERILSHPTAAIVLVQADHSALPEGPFDSILLSSVLGHYTWDEQVSILREAALRLAPDGELLIIDSSWNNRASGLHPQRSGYVNRNTTNSSHAIYKHYFVQREVVELVNAADLTPTELYFGTYFWSCSTRPTESDSERRLRLGGDGEEPVDKLRQLGRTGNYREAIRYQLLEDSVSNALQDDAAHREVQFAVALQHAGFFSLAISAYRSAA